MTDTACARHDITSLVTTNPFPPVAGQLARWPFRSLPVLLCPTWLTRNGLEFSETA